MKIVSGFVLFILVSGSLFFYNTTKGKNETKGNKLYKNIDETKSSDKAGGKCTYAVNKKSVVLTWTGYKFTEKAPVSGTFTDIFWGAGSGTDVNDLMSNLKFQVKTKSVDSGNGVRDKRLYNSFFKMMENGEFIEGYGIKFVETQNKAVIEVNMNGVRFPVTFDTEIKKDWSFSLKGKIDMLTGFKMKKAYDSIAKLCEKLHTGKDGVAKTWSDVALSITGKIIKTCP